MEIQEQNVTKAKDCQLFGIISLVTSFVLPGLVPVVLAVFSFKFYKEFLQIDNGLDSKSKKTAESGRICSIITVCLQIVYLVLMIIAILVICGVFVWIKEWTESGLY